MKNYLIPAAILAGAIAAHAQSQSVYLPAPYQFVVTPVYVRETYDKFWLGDDKSNIPRIDQHTGLVQGELGLCPWFAVDAAVGYTRSSFHPPGPDPSDFKGMIDTTFGGRVRFLDETKFDCPFIPSLGVRVGGILQGDYETSRTLPHSPGDGADGVEGSLLFGKLVGDTGVAFFGDVGWRHRGEDVPEDVFGSVGLSYTTPINITLSAAYRYNIGMYGKDIGDRNFTFPTLQEKWNRLEAGIGYTDKGGRYYQFFYSRTFAGLNTGEKNIFGVSASFPFGGK